MTVEADAIRPPPQGWINVEFVPLDQPGEIVSYNGAGPDWDLIFTALGVLVATIPVIAFLWKMRPRRKAKDTNKDERGRDEGSRVYGRRDLIRSDTEFQPNKLPDISIPEDAPEPRCNPGMGKPIEVEVTMPKEYAAQQLEKFMGHVLTDQERQAAMDVADKAVQSMPFPRDGWVAVWKTAYHVRKNAIMDARMRQARMQNTFMQSRQQGKSWAQKAWEEAGQRAKEQLEDE